MNLSSGASNISNFSNSSNSTNVTNSHNSRAYYKEVRATKPQVLKSNLTQWVSLTGRGQLENLGLALEFAGVYNTTKFEVNPIDKYALNFTLENMKTFDEGPYNSTKATVNLITLINGLWEASNPDGFNYTNATISSDWYRTLNETYVLGPDEKTSFFLRFEAFDNATLSDFEGDEYFLQW
uniref:Uncharacterized protein n=1 Tax=Strombidium inclinatum TaxID=197538 RepID=A0A7S3N0U4_9SPIT|mmetsp:Transcript_36472/g.55991  ORF Transcript_36472/g.55991 Transcript_36472/m.55991 type:complete len:181 (+) Transcript_36472:1272-1814(+)